jgi:hypothetical protein
MKKITIEFIRYTLLGQDSAIIAEDDISKKFGPCRKFKVKISFLLYDVAFWSIHPRRWLLKFARNHCKNANTFCDST